MLSLKFTMVMDEELARKLDYIASYYGRSRIKEIVWACTQYVKELEEPVGKIEDGDACFGVPFLYSL